MIDSINSQQREHFYNVLFSRRDVRAEFLPDSIPHDSLTRILYSAHHAPSVGLSQPWNFILVDDPMVKQQVYGAFKQANAKEADAFPNEKRQQYRSLKLAGILDAPVNILITCDRARGGEVVLGKTMQPETDLYSSVCAIQNLWLAARAENLGMGWVSILETDALKEIFQLPPTVVPIGYLCLGYVSYFYEKPELEEKRWTSRIPLQEVIFTNRWGNQKLEPGFQQSIIDNQTFPRDMTVQSSSDQANCAESRQAEFSDLAEPCKTEINKSSEGIFDE